MGAVAMTDEEDVRASPLYESEEVSLPDASAVTIQPGKNGGLTVMEMDQEIHHRRTYDSGRVSDFFQPDVLLVDQYFDLFKSRKLEPEKELIFAVLKDAIYLYQKYFGSNSKRGASQVREASDWIFVDNDDFFSFNNVCLCLDLNPNYVRSGLKIWAERASEAISRNEFQTPNARKGRRLVLG